MCANENFIKKLNDNDLTHSQIRSILDEPTALARANKLKQLSGINLLAELRSKFDGKPNISNWLNNEVSTNATILNKLDDLPVSVINNLETDMSIMNPTLIATLT